MRSKILVIVNPAAGGGRARRVQPLIADYLTQQGRPADFIESRSSEDIQRRAREAATSGYRFIVALGGDGAFHHVVEGTFGLDVTLGVFPAGNGNDIAVGLGIPTDPIVAADSFLKSRPQPIDVLRATFLSEDSTRIGSPTEPRQAIYVGAGGMGLDAEAARLANIRFRRWPGVTRYIAGALWQLATFAPLRLEAEIDDERWTGRALLVAVANAPCYGSGFRIAPEAAMNDGWLDVTLVGDMSWLRLLEAIPVVLRSRDWRWDEVRRYRARRVVLRADRLALVHGDGELLGEAPAVFEVLPAAIRVMVPPRR